MPKSLGKETGCIYKLKKQTSFTMLSLRQSFKSVSFGNPNPFKFYRRRHRSCLLPFPYTNTTNTAFLPFEKKNDLKTRKSQSGLLL